MDLGSILATGGTVAIVVFVLWIASVEGVVAFGLWLTYTIIWRSVRRGMREFTYETELGRATALSRGPAKDSWSLSTAPEPVRHDRGPRDW